MFYLCMHKNNINMYTEMYKMLRIYKIYKHTSMFCTFTYIILILYLHIYHIAQRCTSMTQLKIVGQHLEL